MEPIFEEVLKGHKIEIHSDDDGINPRHEWDNMGTMVCFHGRYNLGDKDHGFKQSNYDSWAELQKAIIREHGPCLIAPLYLYDHSGITISMGEFSCKWDSGQVGFIFVPHSRIRKEYSCKRISKKTLERAKGCLESEVKVYDDYLTGNVYGFKIFDDVDGENEIDSCWGFFGDYEEGALAEARSIVHSRTDTFRNAVREKLREVENQKKAELADKLDAALEHQQELNKEVLQAA
jgi:hypothetical protein